MNIKIATGTMLVLLLHTGIVSAQKPTGFTFTRADTLRGSNTPERAWWDVLHYTVAVAPDFHSKTIEGKTAIRFRATAPGKVMQIDLQEPMQINGAYTEKKGSGQKDKLSFSRDGNVYHIFFPETFATGQEETVVLVFGGNPRIAVRPPWDGGWIFKTDERGRPWMSVACQGLGASVWYPCKDIQSDEPDEGAQINIAIPDTLVAVANGRLQGKKSYSKGMMTWQWVVKNPINNYNIVPYIGKYVNWKERFAGEKGKLDCDYWVLDYELDKAKKQFKQVPAMLRCFEHWMGPFPFYEDGFKLVQSPHLGMEHQSAVAYGNGFQNGYLGRDLSGTGWGLKWDFIIVHESGHEWFGNNITSKDIADMWIHEGFTNYTETLFTEWISGRQAADAYNHGIRQHIRNDIPVTGPYGVNKQGSGDMYSKASNMLHSIRNAVQNDVLFRQTLREMNTAFYHKTVTGKDIEQLMSRLLGIPVDKIFNQYLLTTDVPVLEYYFSENRRQVFFRWTNCVDGFNLPIFARKGNKRFYINPEANEWKQQAIDPAKTFYAMPEEIEQLFYVNVKQVKAP